MRYLIPKGTPCKISMWSEELNDDVRVHANTDKSFTIEENRSLEKKTGKFVWTPSHEITYVFDWKYLVPMP